MTTLNVIGPGRVGRTLAALWHRTGVFIVQDVCATTAEGARSAVAFIGGGHAVAAARHMRAAGVWMVATPDRLIASVAGELAASQALGPGDVVFHCSGALTSRELGAAATCGACVASVHPLKTFADPADAVSTFSGTHCAAEGDAPALAVLEPAFVAIGGQVAMIDPQFKTAYHAASVIVCNDLTALMEAGLRCYEKAGLDRGRARAMMEPLVRETLDNVFRKGTVAALTGPVSRGDGEVVARQLEALAQWDPRIAAIYRSLGAVAVELAHLQGQADPRALERIAALLEESAAPTAGPAGGK